VTMETVQGKDSSRTNVYINSKRSKEFRSLHGYLMYATGIPLFRFLFRTKVEDPTSNSSVHSTLGFIPQSNNNETFIMPRWERQGRRLIRKLTPPEINFDEDCYILRMPNEVLHDIFRYVVCVDDYFHYIYCGKDGILNLGLVCKLFRAHVRNWLYRQIYLPQNEVIFCLFSEWAPRQRLNLRNRIRYLCRTLLESPELGGVCESLVLASPFKKSWNPAFKVVQRTTKTSLARWVNILLQQFANVTELELHCGEEDEDFHKMASDAVCQMQNLKILNLGRGIGNINTACVLPYLRKQKLEKLSIGRLSGDSAFNLPQVRLVPSK
jgi:F-box-like